MIKELGSPVGDIPERRRYVQLQSILDATEPKGRRYSWKSEYLPCVDEDLLERLISHGSRIPSPHSAAILFQMAGALNEKDPAHSAVGYRDARYVFNDTSAWDGEAEHDVNIQWAPEAWSDLKEFSTGEKYLNFLNEDEGPQRLAEALGGGMERLRESRPGGIQTTSSGRTGMFNRDRRWSGVG